MLRTTNKRIIDAAMNLIIQKGYRAATTKEIAEKAKVSEATIFRNFKNKQGLMKAMIEQQTPVPESMITKAEGDLYEDLLHFAATLLQQLEQKRSVPHLPARTGTIRRRPAGYCRISAIREKAFNRLL